MRKRNTMTSLGGKSDCFFVFFGSVFDDDDAFSWFLFIGSVIVISTL